MIKINILTKQNKYSGLNDFYPIFKWRKEFMKSGIKFSFFYNHLKKKIYDADILIIDSRYPEMIVKGHYKISSKQVFNDDSFIIDFIKRAKIRGLKKVILLDNADGGSSISFHITPYVDVHLKKQIYYDKSRYHNHNEYNFMPWLPEGEEIKEKKNPKIYFTPLRKEDIHKLKLSWNIGMCDYKKFLPFKKYFPFGVNPLFNYLYQSIDFKEPSISREVLLTYRDSSNKSSSYDYQRNLVKKELNELHIPNAIVGDKIPFNEYIKEQKNSKISISPFGYGEICYRDFESIINGCLLVKPSMDHLDTYPQFYTDETYVPFSWDGKNLINKIEEINDNYEDYIIMIEKAQSLFKKSQSDSESFIEHFKANVID